MSTNIDFFQSDTFKQLIQCIQEKYGKIEYFTVCNSFESTEDFTKLAQVEEKLEVVYPTEEDEEIESDEYVIESIIERDEYEFLKDIEGDKQAIDYVSEHSDGLSVKSRKKLEEMRKELS